MLCGACLSQISNAVPQSRRKIGFSGVLVATAGFLIVWLLFCLAGWAILQLRDRAPQMEGSRDVLVSTA
jgi:hypothetical protein